MTGITRHGTSGLWNPAKAEPVELSSLKSSKRPTALMKEVYEIRG
jgi:hypothetical protein